MKYLFCLLWLSLCCRYAVAQGYRLEGSELRFEQELTFKKGSAELNTEDIAVLKAVKEFMDEKKYVSLLRIEGNVQGSDNDQLLSERRAMAAAQWLVQAGIGCERLLPVGFGSTKPADRRNRISFQMASLRGKLMGGMPADGGGRIAGDLCKTKTGR
ncbi:MAG: OmpA family protein [Chitinophagaceae bacterium]|nr:OmpA family protein [Chitinophagaceae bacterium]